MLVTEEEAKTKACCQAHEWYQGQLMTAPCVASACMSWRWGESEPELRGCRSEFADIADEDLDRFRLEEPERPEGVPAEWAWVPISGDEDIEGGFWEEPSEMVRAENAAKKAARRGFCGLAGSAH